jgi:hypothetical protein
MIIEYFFASVVAVHHTAVGGWWFSPGTPVSSTNKTDRHDITEILLKVALNIIKQTSIFELTSVVIDTDCIGLANYHDDHGHDGSLV